MDLATIYDVTDQWRPLPSDQEARMIALLGKASRMIRAQWPDVDARITSGALDAGTVADFVVELAIAGFTAPENPGVTREDKSAGPFSQSLTYGRSGMSLTADMIRYFNGGRTSRVAWLA